MKLSERQAEALTLVRAGRITYGDPYPNMTARRRERDARHPRETRDILGNRTPAPPYQPVYVFLLDGCELYASQHATFRALDERGLLTYEPPTDWTGTPPVPVTATA